MTREPTPRETAAALLALCNHEYQLSDGFGYYIQGDDVEFTRQLTDIAADIARAVVNSTREVGP